MLNNILPAIKFKDSFKFDKKHLLVFILIVFSSNTLPVLYNPLVLIIPFLFIVLFFYKDLEFPTYKHESKLLFGGFALLILTYTIINLSFDPLFTLRFFLLITISYFTISILGYDLFNIFENIVYKLTVISLFFFSIQLISSGFVFNLLRIFETILFIPTFNDHYATIIIYTFNAGNYDSLRNCGFTWEPGPFGSFLNIAIFISLIKSKFAFTKHFFVFTIALITTLSTTAYFAFFVILLWRFYNLKNKKIVLLSIPIIILIFSYIYINTPFLKNKIESEYFSSQDDLTFHLHNPDLTRNISLNRFPGFLLNLIDFAENPIIGFGGKFEKTQARLYGTQITSTSGLGNWLAQFGAVGMIFFIFSWFKSLDLLKNISNFKGTIALFVVILIISFGFNQNYAVIYFSFMLFYYFLKPKKIKNV